MDPAQRLSADRAIDGMVAAFTMTPRQRALLRVRNATVAIDAAHVELTVALRELAAAMDRQPLPDPAPRGHAGRVAACDHCGREPATHAGVAARSPQTSARRRQPFTMER